MIDISLVEKTVNTEKFSLFDLDRPCLFLGFAIKNEYDNRRLEICEKYKPLRKLFAFTKKDEYRLLPLYGLFLPLNQLGDRLAKTLVTQEKTNNMNFKIYEDLLFEYNLTCKDSYSYLNKNIYPIDFKHFTELTDSDISSDDKILQHLLQLEEDKFDFQKFGAFKLLILT